MPRQGTVSPRNPFRKDELIFDYEFDSDDEWEVDEGENISDSEGENEDVEDSDMEGELRKDGLVEDGWLMPEAEDNFRNKSSASDARIRLIGPWSEDCPQLCAEESGMTSIYLQIHCYSQKKVFSVHSKSFVLIKPCVALQISRESRHQVFLRFLLL